MRKMELEELKAHLCGLLRRFIAFCEENNLTYYMAYGSLLGTVRHQGFIPWDDDLDVMMPREDYDRFIELLHSGKPELDVKSSKYTPGYIYDYAKISDESTRIKSVYFQDIDNMGIFIDVFPMDGVCLSGENSEAFKRKIVRNHSLMMMSGLKKFWPSQGKVKTAIKYFAYVYARLRGTGYWLEKKRRLLEKYRGSGQPTHYVSANSIVRSCYFEGEETFGIFEGIRVACPHDAAGCLTEEYGDYMQLPPVEERVSAHDFIAYVLG